MTPEQKMQAIVEAAGECWHRGTNPLYPCTCAHCGEALNIPASKPWNPSPTDLNELFRLAEKLDLYLEIDSSPKGLTQISAHSGGVVSKKPAGQGTGGSLKVALLNALFKATENGNEGL